MPSDSPSHNTGPFVGNPIPVPETWMDINGHMNATHYGLVIYAAHAHFTDYLGLGDDYVEQTQCGKAVLESHIVYEREVGANALLEPRSYLLAVDHKRLHFFHELVNLTTGLRVATGEQVDIHINLKARRSSPLPAHLQARLQGVVRAHRSLRPEGVGSFLRPPKNDWLS